MAKTLFVSLQHCQNLWCRSYHLGDPDVKHKSVTWSSVHPLKDCECDTEHNECDLDDFVGVIPHSHGS